MNDENKIVGLGDALEEVNQNEYKIIEEENDLELPQLDKATEDIKYEKSFKGLFNYLTTQDTLGLIMVFIRLLIICAIIYAFKIFGVDFVKEMGFSILYLFGIVKTDLIDRIWIFICDFVFYISAIIVFVSIITTRYDNLLKKKEDKK